LAPHRIVHHAVLLLYEDLVSALLQREGRISYRTLTQLFGFDAVCLDHVRQELVFKQLAHDAHGEGLEWTGSPPRVSQTSSGHAEPTDAADARVSASPDEVPALPAAPMHPAPEAERRQLTVLFCDLVGSTQLSGQLDPEDLRAVVRAYQEAAAAVIQRYEGHIAQYLGDGLLVYFGFPVAHEDDARRAVHTGLGIVQAIATLNTRLAARSRVQLAVRLGIHTGPVVVGQMGGGERHEHLALGETPNIAARLQNLAPANAVVISAVTARLVRNMFHLEDLGTHMLPGVAEPMALSRVRGLLATSSSDEDFVTAAVPVLVGREEESGSCAAAGSRAKVGTARWCCSAAKPALASRSWWRVCGPKCAPRACGASPCAVHPITPTARSIP
jgi:class 3 adenylate cyclase